MSYRIPVGAIHVTEAMRHEIAKVIESGRFSEGSQVQGFEDEWAAYLRVEHVVAMNSGTSALLAALLALKERYPEMKQKVITTPLTYAADVNAIIMAGMEPVFVDICAESFLMRFKQVQQLVENRPDEYGLILPVHLMGFNAPMSDYVDLAQQYGLRILEDIAEAQGAMDWDGKPRVFGNAAACSFYIAHNIQAGELGAVATDDPVLAGLMRSIKANGRACRCRQCDRHCSRPPDPRFLHERIGLNLKATEWSAAIARAQIPLADEIVKRRRENFNLYTSRLERHRSWLQLPPWWSTSSPFAYPLVAKNGDRPQIIRALENGGIETRPLFGCLPTQQPAFAKYKAQYEGKLPIAENIGRQGFYIGCHQYITPDDIEHVGQVLDKYAKERGYR